MFGGKPLTQLYKKLVSLFSSSADFRLRGTKVVGIHETKVKTVDIPIDSVRPFKVITDYDNIPGERFSWAVKVVNFGSKVGEVTAHIKEGLGYSIRVRKQVGNSVAVDQNGIHVSISPTCMTTFVVTYTPTKKTIRKLVEFVIVFDDDCDKEGTKHYLGYFLGTLTGLTLMEGRQVLTVKKL